MFRVLGVIQVFFIIMLFYKYVKRQGFCIMGDGLKIMLFLWLTDIALYNLQISKLYNPNLLINLVVLGICLSVYLVSRKLELTNSDIEDLMHEEKEHDLYKVYSIISSFIFIAGVILFIVNVKNHGLALLNDDKRIDKQVMNHYHAYVIYMLALVAQIKYILFRQRKKILEIAIFIGSLAILALTLNRGPLAYVVITIYIYELFGFIKKFKQMSKNKKRLIYISFIGFFILSVLAFGFIGDARVAATLARDNETLNQHYMMPEWLPTSFVWLYIYLTSPLENTAFAILNGGVELTFLNKLFYPFIKLFNNLIGNGDGYKAWLESRGSYEPYLWEKVGLNAKSFIPDAMQDLGIVGVIIYLLLYAVIIGFGVYVIKNRRRFSSIGAIVIYSNIISIILWSVFVSSLSIPVLILNIMLICFVELSNNIYKYKFRKINNNKIE